MELLFGIAHSTVCKIVQEICNAIVKSLLHKWIVFPTGDKLDELIDGFKSK